MRVRKKQQRRRRGRAIAWIVFLIFAASLVNYFRPLPVLTATPSQPLARSTENNSLPWPVDATAAVGASGFGVLATSSQAETPIPTASLAKMITVLAVLKKKPLELGQQGPTITLDNDDVASFGNYLRAGGSVTLVTNGQKITQYQAFQSILLPSSNNMADSTARWAFGSLASYQQYAQEYVKQLGLEHTIVGTDASGLSPTTTSTPSDLVKLGIIAMQHPVIAEIVGQPNATVPVAGVIPNVNRLLGKEGVNGIKTGNSDEARGCLLFSVNYEVSPGMHVTIVGAIMGSPSVNKAIQDAVPLIQAAKRSFSVENVVRAGQSFGNFYVPWTNNTVHAVAQHDGAAVTWRHAVSPVEVSGVPVKAPSTKNTPAGSMSIQTGSTTTIIPLLTDRDIPEPSFWWRLIRW